MGKLPIRLGALTALVALAAAAPAQTRLMPGDRLEVSWESDCLVRLDRTVGPDGMIGLPGIGAIGVATHSTSEVRLRIQDALIEEGIAAWDISVKRTGSADPSISLAGAVTRPSHGRYVASPKLSELVRSGLPADTADLSQVVVESGSGQRMMVDLNRNDLELQPGDRVTVVQLTGGTYVNVIGGVENPTAVAFHPGLSVKDALLAAKGITGHGDSDRVLVVRRDESIPILLPTDETFLLRPGDTVQVTLRVVRTFVSVVGAVARPGIVEFAPGTTVTKAIEAAGGIKGAVPASISIRSVVSGKNRTIKLSLPFILSGRIPDPVLSPDDVLEVGAVGPKR